MSGLYARCDTCTGVFEVPGFFGGNAAAVNLAGNTVSPCTLCGWGPGRILDGTYSLKNDKMSLVDGPQSSWDALKELAQVVSASVAAGEAREKTFERAAQIDPRFNKFKRYAIEAAIALNMLIELASNANAVYDWYDALSGNKARQEYSQQLKTSEEGATLALEKFHASQEYKAFQGRMAHELVEPPPPPEASRLGLRPNPLPVLEQFPIAAKKLTDYQKNRGKNH